MTRTERPARAVIVAAGRAGSTGRWRGRPAPLIRVGGTPVLHRALRNLALAGVRDVLLIAGPETGPLAACADEALGSVPECRGMTVSCVASDRHGTVGALHALGLSGERFSGDTYVLNGDVVFDADLLDLLETLTSQGADAAIAVVRYAVGMHGTLVQTDGRNRVIRMFEARADEPPGTVHKTVAVCVLGASFLREQFAPALAESVRLEPVAQDWESVLAAMVDRSWRGLVTVECGGCRSCELDELDDWLHAEILFADPAARFDLINLEYGRYQRNGAADHLVMTNVHFPVEAMRSDLRREMDALITDYPSAQRTHARLMGAVTDQSPEHLIVANGASELIKIICASADRPVIVPVPTYNEYEAAVPPDRLVRFPLEPPRFTLDVERLADAAVRTAAGLVVVVSPNNPTGLAVPRQELEWLVDALDKQGNVRLLLDESFVDFCADPARQSLADWVAARRHLAILKSLSMACGVPGIRLACLMAADAAFLASVRRQMPVWNVNAIAEGFLRLLPRYRADLARTCAQVRRECDALSALLGAIPGVVPYPSSACFCFTRLPAGVDAEEVARTLFTDHQILVKSCGGKSMPRDYGYLRIKSRTPAENARFAAALSDVLDRMLRPGTAP